MHAETADSEAGQQPGDAPRVVVLTTVRNEAAMLPRWLRYYGGQVGLDNLVVLDDNSTDGSTDSLGCSVVKLPPAPWKVAWSLGRIRIVNNLAKALFTCYDVVIFTDVDEFLVPDPSRYDGLRDFLQSKSDDPVIAPVAVNVLHLPEVEPGALDADAPVLSQRSFVKFVPAMCKPAIKRVPAPWSPAFHGIRTSYEIDRELLMVHLKFADIDGLRRTAALRRQVFEEESRGSVHSSWKHDADEMEALVRRWGEVSDAGAVPELRVDELPLDSVVSQRDNGFYRSEGSQASAMASQPLRRLPEHYRELV